MINGPIRCITIGRSTVQGPDFVPTGARNFQTGEYEPTGYGTIDGKYGRLVDLVRQSPEANLIDERNG